MRSIRLHTLVVVRACTMAAVLAVPAFAERSKPLRGTQPDRLLALAAQKPTIRVIVGVAIDEPMPKRLRVRTELAEPSDELEELRRREIREKKSLLSTHPRVRRVAGRDFQSIPYFVAEVDEEGLRHLMADERVTSIEENRSGQVQLIESTRKVGSTTANASGQRGNGQYIVIIDTGVFAEHPFLAGRVVGADAACFSGGGSSYQTVCQNQQHTQFGPNAGSPCPFEDLDETCDHGTHVAGIAAGRNNGNGFNGVAPDAWIIPIQVVSYKSYCVYGGRAYACGATVESDDVLSALEYVNSTLLPRHPVAAVNISIRFQLHGSRAECDAANPAFAYIISVLKSKKVAVVAGTGNDREINGPGGIGMPACITGAVAVGASTDGDTTAYYSNTGFQDLMAPGGEPVIGIYSSTADYFPPFYVEKSGTSMATPHVAGAFALLRAAKPTATVTKLLDDLKVTGTPIPDPGLGGWTFPRINIPAALARP